MYFIISLIICLINLLTIGNPVGVLFSLLQYIIILYLIIIKKYKEALFWHIFFIATSISSVSVVGMNQNGEVPNLYNYFSLKLIGPVGCSYVISILLFLLSLKGKRESRNKTIKQLTLVILYLGITGDVIGILGFCLKSGYYLPDFIKYNIYIWITYFTLHSLSHFADKTIIRQIYISSVPLISGGIISCTFGYLLGIGTSYGGLEIPYISDICYFGPILILAFVFNKDNRFLVLVSLGCYSFLMVFAMSGKMVFMILLALIYVAYRIFFDKDLKKRIKYIIPIRIIILIFIMITIIYIPILASDTTSLTGIKIAAALSIFSGEIGDVSNSPATRIAEIANFYYNNRTNPFHLLFGMGYGGYFTDELGMLNGLDLSGGWSDEVIRSGRYSSAHDTFSVVPLLNGVVGFFIILWIGFRLLSRIKNNYLAFAVVPWIFFTFYFSTIYAVASIFFIFGSLYTTDYEKNSIY